VTAGFELATAGRIVFGAGRVVELGAMVRALPAGRVLLVTGRTPGRASAAVASLRESGLETTLFQVPGEPSVELVREGVAAAKQARADAVVACGGGSALDAGKAIAALATNPGDVYDYLEVVGRGEPLVHPPLPFVAVPTTAGTGSEVTRNAVLHASEHEVKASLRSPLMLPRIALVDPDLLEGAPPQVIASSGMDALSQLVEPYLSVRANPLTDALAREGIARSARSLHRACLEGADASAREDLALASLLGGICLANAGLGAVHGIAAPAGGMLGAPHGALCAALLPAVFAVNLSAVRDRVPARADRFREVAVLVTGRAGAQSEDGLAFFDALRHDLSIPGLASYGLDAGRVPALVARSLQASSTRANPVELTEAELTEIVLRSM